MICREKVSCMGVNCEEVLILSFLPRQCHPDSWLKVFLAELQDGEQQMSCVLSASCYSTHFLFFLPLSSFIAFASGFALVLFSIYYHMLKVSELDIVRVDLLWFIVSDLFVS